MEKLRLCQRLSFSISCRNLSKVRLIPPEFTKEYVGGINNDHLEQYRTTKISRSQKLNTPRHWETSPRKAPDSLKLLYQELIPHNLDPRYRDRLRERLERREMMLRRRNLHIPEFYTGSILAVSVADQFAPDQIHRFVGLCVLRENESLWSSFTLRNVIDKTAVEIRYELYNPTIKSIEVLLLEKRLDENLLYLRDAPLQESRVPFDMAPVPHAPDTPVPVNPKKVHLLPPPWRTQWHLHGYLGLDDSIYSYLTDEHLKAISRKRTGLVGRYDLMKMYRSRPTPEDVDVALGDVHLQHQDLISLHEARRKELVAKHQRNKIMAVTNIGDVDK